MGQKVNPIGFRLPITRDWTSRWYASEKEFADFLHADQMIRGWLKKKLKTAAVSRIVIERAWNSVRVTIFTARPGIVIGRKGSEIETMTREVSRLAGGKQAKIDIIEIKKPFTNSLLSSSKYRDNYTPKKELSGSVMQVEKYLFHLNKWGVEGEKQINAKRSSELPSGMKIKVTNPKAMLILGRDNDFAADQKFDFEIIKRKYVNIVDIMTYDDLLQRLENIIAKFKVKS